MKVGVDEIEENNEGEIGQLVTSGMPDGHENHQGQSSACSNRKALKTMQAGWSYVVGIWPVECRQRWWTCSG